jgi:hypothetical protein
MAWWGWLLLAWALVAVLLALGLGAAARAIKLEERAAAAVDPLVPPAEPSGDALSPPATALSGTPRRARLSGGASGGAS